MRRLNPKKLLLSKWTAVNPINKELHFIVRCVVKPENETLPVEQFELEAIHSGRAQIIHWRELLNEEKWLQGWK
ncbi:MAG: TIGR02450 family Trp-rich protein [Limnobacter sp.]|nr:TIGR02450 family Trp-rich protein [Limnobacter sp.]